VGFAIGNCETFSRLGAKTSAAGGFGTHSRRSPIPPWDAAPGIGGDLAMDILSP
jgi:hypothetical protein